MPEGFCILPGYLVTYKNIAKLKKVIMDRFNTIAPKQTIGHDTEADSQKYYIDPSGIVVIPRGKSKF